MAVDFREESFEEVEVLGKPALFTTLRILDKTVPPNLHCYDLRHEDDDWSVPAQIEKFVMVNHYGTIVTTEPFDLGEDGFLSIPPGEFRHDVDHSVDVMEWQQKSANPKKEVCEGYEITDRISVGHTDFVIGRHPKAPNPYVTWQANKDDPQNFFWGHYMNDRLSALDDLCDRVKEQISLARLRQVPNKSELANKPKQKCKKRELER